MAARFRRWFRRGSEEPQVIYRNLPLEVPVVTEVKRRLVRGETGAAVAYGYHQALTDLARAFGLTYPPSATHRELLAQVFGARAHELPFEFLQELYLLYEPIRYGHIPPDPKFRLAEVLTSLYAHPRLQELYLPRGPGAATEAPASAG